MSKKPWIWLAWRIYETVRGSDVFVVQSTCSFVKEDKAGTVNDALMERWPWRFPGRRRSPWWRRR